MRLKRNKSRFQVLVVFFGGATLIAAHSAGAQVSGNIYSCVMTQMDDGAQISYAGWSEYQTKLGWNEVSISNLSMHGVKDGYGRIGLCAYLSSEEPQHVSLNATFVEGEQLKISDNICGFSGKTVSIYPTSIEIHSNSEQLTIKRDLHFPDVPFLKSVVLVAGIRPNDDGAPVKECAKAFEEATGTPFVSTQARGPLPFQIFFPARVPFFF